MIEQLETIVEKRSQSHNLIEELVLTRNDMLALFGKLANLKPFIELDDATREILQEFCETLVDYTLQAHLNLYRYIEEKLEKRRKIIELADNIYPNILKSTEFISNFNDTYESIDKNLDSSHLESDLSKLGETMAVRIELEDQLIAELTNRIPEVSVAQTLHS